MNKQQPNRDLLIAICRERAEKFGAKVEFEYFPREKTTLVGFTEKSPAPGKDPATYTVEIVQVSQDTNCPSCGATIGTGGVAGSKPHNVIPASMWGGIIDAAFAAYGVSLPVADAFYGQIRAAGTETTGKAVTADMQCRACETRQDTPASGLPHSLVQRSHAPAGPNKQAYVGNHSKIHHQIR